MASSGLGAGLLPGTLARELSAQCDVDLAERSLDTPVPDTLGGTVGGASSPAMGVDTEEGDQADDEGMARYGADGDPSFALVISGFRWERAIRRRTARASTEATSKGGLARAGDCAGGGAGRLGAGALGEGLELSVGEARCESEATWCDGCGSWAERGWGGEGESLGQQVEVMRGSVEVATRPGQGGRRGRVGQRAGEGGVLGSGVPDNLGVDTRPSKAGGEGHLGATCGRFQGPLLWRAGDPLGSFHLAVPLQVVMERVQERGPGVIVFAYLDDGLLTGLSVAAAAAYEIYMEEEEAIGLNIQPTKSAAYSPKGKASYKVAVEILKKAAFAPVWEDMQELFPTHVILDVATARPMADSHSGAAMMAPGATAGNAEASRVATYGNVRPPEEEEVQEDEDEDVREGRRRRVHLAVP
ncbi:hypothetical protein CYMTET_28668 [Cymbomonas tetramitiformis]|uniref:Uncharacterized protein n=1 Tax=Cymbomonas tetramitiformis TaxID=36881 RepID=A0AAE0FMI8_9CHLO|nr:hypothetical protein CYMTET_28668 [Cymbomonas tetramitiformis]